MIELLSVGAAFSPLRRDPVAAHASTKAVLEGGISIDNTPPLRSILRHRALLGVHELKRHP